MAGNSSVSSSRDGGGVGGFLRFCGFIVFLLAVSQTRDLEASLAPRGGKVGIAHLSG